MKKDMVGKFFKNGTVMKKINCKIGILVAVLIFGVQNRVCAMEEKQKELVPLEELNIEIPAEVLVNIVMNILPSSRLLNSIDIKKASNELVTALQKIMKSLGLKYFSPQGSLFKTLVQKIKEQGYKPEVLTQAIEAAADNKELFIAFMLIKAGADLPYGMFYNSVRLLSDYGWKKLLALLKKLKTIDVAVDLNAMPFYDKDLNQDFHNPLQYLMQLYINSIDPMGIPTSTNQYYRETIDVLITWAKQNGYLRSLFAFDNEDDFNELIRLFKDPKISTFQYYIHEKVKGDNELYQKIIKVMPDMRFMFM